MFKLATTWHVPLVGMRLLYIQELEVETIIGLETDSKPAACPRCHSSEIVGYGRMNLRVRDLPIAEKKVVLDIKRRRLRCQKCGATFNEPVERISEHHRATERLVKNVAKMALRFPFTKISRELAMNEKTVRNIFSDLLADFKTRPRPIAPNAVTLWLPIILRAKRAVWINQDEATILGMDECKPASIKESLCLMNNEGRTQTVYVPPDAQVIKAIIDYGVVRVVLHASLVKMECRSVLQSAKVTKETGPYIDALQRLLKAKTPEIAQDCWTDLHHPPTGLRTKMKPLLAAVELLGKSSFDGFAQQNQTIESQLEQLETLLRSSFAKRSYDVMWALLMFDKYLHKTSRTVVDHSNIGTNLNYEKFNLGTSIPKLIALLKGMAKDGEKA